MRIGIWYTYFILIKDRKNNIINFEARPGVDIYDVSKEIIKYLDVTGNEKSYILKFNDRELSISKFVTAKEVVNEYFAGITKSL